MKIFISLISFLLLGSSAFAVGTVTIQPGGEVLVEADQSLRVRCDGSSTGSDQTVLCDCYYNGTKYGEAVADTGHASICEDMRSGAAPRNCESIDNPVICDCYYNGTKYGEVVGEDTLGQCREIRANSSPNNCRTL